MWRSHSWSERTQRPGPATCMLIVSGKSSPLLGPISPLVGWGGDQEFSRTLGLRVAWSPSRTPEGPTLLQEILEPSLPWWPPLSHSLHSSGPERKQTLPGAVTWADPSRAWTEGCGGRPGKRAWRPACAQKHMSAHMDRHGRQQPHSTQLGPPPPP